jgi:hypothetical protein
MQWEYRIEAFADFELAYVEKRLNEWGEDGWELVNISPSLKTYFFKRLKEDE